MIIATCDRINLLLAENYEVISKYFFLPFNNKIEILIDKESFYTQMEKQQVLIPETYIPKSREELNEYVKLLGFPLIIKPKCMFNNDFHMCFNNKILKIFNEKEYENFKDKILRVFDKIIIQKLIGGDKNIAIYGYYDGKGFRSCCMIDKDAMSSWGTTILGHYFEDSEFKIYAEGILKKIGYIGYAELEFIYDSADKSFKLLEINSRPVQWCRLCSKLKNSIESIPIEILNGKFNSTIVKVTSIKEKYIYYGIGLIESSDTGKIGLIDVIKYFCSSQYVSMYWDRKDLIPSFRYMFSFVKVLLKAVIKRFLVMSGKGLCNY